MAQPLLLPVEGTVKVFEALTIFRAQEMELLPRNGLKQSKPFKLAGRSQPISQILSVLSDLPSQL